MKKLIFLIFLLLVYTNSYAETKATPVVYRVIVNKVELYNSTTPEWVEVGEGNATFNIASVAGGQKAGSYASNSSIPAGVYTQIRVTVSRTMYIKGEDGLGKYTATGNLESDETQANATEEEDLYDAGTVVLSDVNIAEEDNLEPAEDDDYFTYTQDLPTSVTVERGLAITLRVKFDVDDALTFEDDVDDGCSMDAPVISVENID